MNMMKYVAGAIVSEDQMSSQESWSNNMVVIPESKATSKEGYKIGGTTVATISFQSYSTNTVLREIDNVKNSVRVRL